MQIRKAPVLATLAVLYFVPGFIYLWPACDVDARTESADAKTGMAVLTAPDEPGEPLEVTGTVYAPDGETPVAGVEIYVYHTDAEGLYSATNDNTDPRIKATLRTGDDGRYAYRTIRPASYPDGRVPAHVHYVVSGAGYPEQRFNLHFADDPYLSERSRQRSADLGRFGSIRPLESGDDGVWRCVRDLRLRR